MPLQIEYEEGDERPRNFHHPYEPYPIQLDFMNALYDCIEKGQVGIFESPTGTGKSLSLICGTLAWLREKQERDWLALSNADSDDEPDWIIEHTKKAKKEAFLAQKQQLETHLAKVRAKELLQKQRYENGEPLAKRFKLDQESKELGPIDDENQFLLEDYDSEVEDSTGRGSKVGLNDGLSATTLELLAKVGMISDRSEEEIEIPETTKIFYCSRTHSQLIQFAHEVRKVKFPPSSTDEASDSLVEEVKHLALGSRKNLCINPAVYKLGSANAINERCLELQTSTNGKGSRCAFLPTKETEPLLHSFRDRSLASIRDIEDLARLGKEIGICSYYASRAAVKPSEIVTLPYPLMLQKSAREALELSVKDHVVVIDEAHNLMDAISGIHSVTITLEQLQRARAQIGVYLQRFRNRLKGKNRVYVTQVVRTIDSLISYLMSKITEDKKVDGVAKVAELMAGKGADQINLHKLSRYLKESRLARKVDKYTISTAEAAQQKTTPSTPVLAQVENFFGALSNPAGEGCFFYATTEERDVCLKYQLLDPMNHFKEIVQDARAVILAGGTMSPMEDYTNHLFPYLDPSRLKTISCGHIIPPENLVACPVGRGPGGIELDFTFEKRGQTFMIDALGNSLISLASIIPDGLVVFFPSYAYLDQVTSQWKSGPTKIWNRLASLKPIFLESKEKKKAGAAGAEEDEILARYSEAIINDTRGKGGALLLSVVGGKMSEGINFSDRLGRGVVIVGLPFPNIQSAEWKAKLAFVERQAVARGKSAAEGRAAGRELYENACMRAVNQSIGRAIRHRGDYAAIFMLDRRYGTRRIQAKLPGWIQKGLLLDGQTGMETGTGTTKSFEAVIGCVKEFFARDR